MCTGRKVFIAAQDSVNIECGAQDKSIVNDVKFFDGTCKEINIKIGPELNDLPAGISPIDLEIIKKCTRSIIGLETVEECKIVPIEATINLIGSDAASKGKIQAVLTNLKVNANGAKTFGEGKLSCGWKGEKADNRALNIATCTLNCIDDAKNGKACDKCRYYEFAGMYLEENNAMCLNGMFLSNRQQQVNSNNNIINTNSNNIIIPFKSLLPLSIIVTIIALFVCFLIVGYKQYNKSNKKSLLNNGSMNNVEIVNQ